MYTYAYLTNTNETTVWLASVYRPWISDFCPVLNSGYNSRHLQPVTEIISQDCWGQHLHVALSTAMQTLNTEELP
jgi:hypothetical protein